MVRLGSPKPGNPSPDASHRSMPLTCEEHKPSAAVACILNGLHLSTCIAMRLAVLALLLALLPAALAQPEGPAAGEVLGADADVVCAIARAEIDGLEKEIESLRETVVTLEDRLRAQTERDTAEVTLHGPGGPRVSCRQGSRLRPRHVTTWRECMFFLVSSSPPAWRRCVRPSP